MGVCAQLCWTLWARILEWVANSFSRESSQPRDRTRVSCIFCIGSWVLYHCATWEALELYLVPGNCDGASLVYSLKIFAASHLVT